MASTAGDPQGQRKRPAQASLAGGEGEYAQLEEMRSGVNPLTEDREVISAGGILPDSDERVEHEFPPFYTNSWPDSL